MSDIIEVPITIASAPGANFLCQVAIATTLYGPPSIKDNSYWFSVYDRTTLAQVFSVVQAGNADTVPADLAGKFNTPQYFLVVATRTLQSAYVPAGALLGRDALGRVTVPAASMATKLARRCQSSASLPVPC